MHITIDVNVKAPELVQAIQMLMGTVKVPATGIKTPAQSGSAQSAVKDEPIQTHSPDPDPEPTAEPENIPTVVELRAKAQEKSKIADGKKAIKELLEKFGCTAISKVPEESRAALMVELEAL